MTLASTIGLIAIAVLIYVTVLFVFSLLLKRNDVADVGWGMGILLIGIVSVWAQGTYSPHALLVLSLVVLWAMRLAIRIGLRNRKKGEDYRYKKWRESWGKWFYLRSYAQVYLLQGLFMLIVGYPLIHAALFGTGSALGIAVIAGVLVWVAGFLFETIADYQLDRHMEDPSKKGQLLTTGLWRYSRHPNYFGEVLVWWGVWLVVLGLPLGLYAVVGPLTITFLILRVSGIPMLESKLSEHPDFLAYKERTSIFIPLPPKQA